MFEYFIKNTTADRYNIMYSIIEHDKKQPTYVDDERIGGSIPITFIEPIGMIIFFHFI